MTVRSDERVLLGQPNAEGVYTPRVRGLSTSALAREGFALVEVRGELVAHVEQGNRVRILQDVGGPDQTPEDILEALEELCALRLRAGAGLELGLGDGLPGTGAWMHGLSDAIRISEEGHGTAMLVGLRDHWLEVQASLAEDVEIRRGERLLRHLDDIQRVKVFEMLRQAWQRAADGWPCGPLARETALARAEEVLGPNERWIKAFRNYTYAFERRLVVIPTWQCELRCSYCYIPKQDGRVMSPSTLERSVDMLLGTREDNVLLQFFGGEAIIEWANVQHTIAYAMTRAEALQKNIRFCISSNGWTLDKQKLDWLQQFPVRLELSLDGDERTQQRFRAARWRGADSYANSIVTHASDILASGLEQYVIMVVHPTNVDAMPANFFHIADLGFRHIQINNVLGRSWKPHEIKSWADGLFAIGTELERRWAAGETLEFINMRHRPNPMRLNGEVTVDWDGTIYGGNGFLHETEHKDKFVMSHLDAYTNIDRYWMDATDNNFLLDWSYRRKVTENNIEVGKIMASFCTWMRKRGFEAGGPT